MRGDNVHLQVQTMHWATEKISYVKQFLMWINPMALVVSSLRDTDFSCAKKISPRFGGVIAHK